MVSSYYIALLIIVPGMALSIWAKKLTTAAAIAGGLSAFVIFAANGIAGIALLAAFFIMGVAATIHHWKEKQRYGLTDNEKGARTSGQVLANAGVAVIVSALVLFNRIELQSGLLMVAGSFASAAADTVSSEIGNVYGRRFYNILSFKKSTRGINGAISLEGTLAGIAASFLIAFIYYIAGRQEAAHIPIIVVAGTIGNIADSVLGTTLENRKLLSNNAVNFLNTGVGAGIALLLHWLFMN
ncbi:MAG: DUF92 domain-containing protein [Agriterribacter sp.]